MRTVWCYGTRAGSDALLVDSEKDAAVQFTMSPASRWFALASVVDGGCVVVAKDPAAGTQWSVPVRFKVVTRLSSSPTGHYLAVAGFDAVDVFDMRTGAAVGHVRINRNDIAFDRLPAWRVVFSPDEQQMAVSSSDATTTAAAYRRYLETGRPDRGLDGDADRDVVTETIRIHDLTARSDDDALPVRGARSAVASASRSHPTARPCVWCAVANSFAVRSWIRPRRG